MDELLDVFHTNLEELIACSICMEMFSMPMSLPCLHTFCRKCIEKTFSAVSQVGKTNFCCPVCRADVNEMTSGSSYPSDEKQALTKLRKNHLVAELETLIKQFEFNSAYFRECEKHDTPLTLYRCWNHELDLCAACLFEHRLCKNVSEGKRIQTLKVGGKTFIHLETVKPEETIRTESMADTRNLHEVSVDVHQQYHPLQQHPMEIRTGVNLSTDAGPCRISGMVAMDNGDLLLTDFMNGAVKILTTSTHRCRVFHRCSSMPCDITVCREHVAITYPNEKEIRIYVLNDQTDGLTEVQTIQLKSPVYGLTAVDDKIVGCAPGFLIVLVRQDFETFRDNRQVFEVKTVFNQGHMECPECIVFSSSGDSVFVTDSKRQSISRISLDGRLQWTKTNRHLKEPTYVICLNGFLLVAFRTSIVLMTDTGQYVDTDVFSYDRLQNVLSMAMVGGRLYTSYKMNCPLRNEVVSVNTEGSRERLTHV